VQRGRGTISQLRPAQHPVILESLQRHAFYPRPRHPHASRGSSPQQRGSTERQLHYLRTHGLHPVSQDALSRQHTTVERRAHQHMAEKVSARCTLCTPAPVSTRARQAMVEAPHYAARSDSVSPAFRPSSSNVHPDAHRRKPCNAGPRLGRALTPPTQTLRTPQCTPPVTDRPGPEHTASPAAACARPAPHSPAPKTMPCF